MPNTQSIAYSFTKCITYVRGERRNQHRGEKEISRTMYTSSTRQQNDPFEPSNPRPKPPVRLEHIGNAGRLLSQSIISSVCKTFDVTLQET